MRDAKIFQVGRIRWKPYWVHVLFDRSTKVQLKFNVWSSPVTSFHARKPLANKALPDAIEHSKWLCFFKTFLFISLKLFCCAMMHRFELLDSYIASKSGKLSLLPFFYKHTELEDFFPSSVLISLLRDPTTTKGTSRCLEEQQVLRLSIIEWH